MDAVDLGPVTLQGARVRLRELGPDDVTTTMEWVTDPEFFRYLAFDVVQHIDEEVAFLAEIVAQAAERPRVHYHLGIEVEALGLVGTARLGVTSFEHRHGDLGYGVRREQWGRGFATEAAGLLLELAFTRLGLHRVSVFHDPQNVASGRVLQKLGLQREGVLRENVWAHARWRDSVNYAILEPEWRERASRAP